MIRDADLHAAAETAALTYHGIRDYHGAPYRSAIEQAARLVRSAA